MSLIALLSAVVGLAVYPGAAYAGTVALLVAGAGRMPRASRPAQLDELLAAFGVAAACGLMVLPDSPLFGLPTGVSLIALIVALAAGVAWGTSGHWPWHRLIAAAATAAPLLGLASMAMTLNLRTIAATGGAGAAARFWAAGAIVLALPAVVRPSDPGSALPSRAILTAAGGLLCASLALFSPLAGAPPVDVVGICSLFALLYAGLIGLGGRLVETAAPALGLVAALPAAVALWLALG